MRRAFVGLAVVIAAFSPIALTCSCKKTAPKERTFGEFSYNGKYLKEYAAKEITAAEAKSIISKSAASTATASLSEIYGAQVCNVSDNISAVPSTPQSVYDRLTGEMGYGMLEATTHFYVSDSNVRQSKVDYLQMTDFRNAIMTNTFTPFSQLVVKNLVVFDDLISFMERENEEFKGSEISVIAPFKNIFTYHTDAKGNLIIQTRDFAELSSSVGGGIGCSYRQDTEIIYDADLKVTKWQTSLGVFSATPNGTIKQGYILEVDFDWLLKN